MSAAELVFCGRCHGQVAAKASVVPGEGNRRSYLRCQCPRPDIPHGLRAAVTPAPWFVPIERAGSNGTQVWARGGDVRIADCSSAAISLEGQRAHARLISAGPDLLAELQKAHLIILNALALMTAEQKGNWARANDRDGVIGEGTTRFHERRAAIAKATGSAS